MKSFSVCDFPPLLGSREGITFIVADDGRILVTREYTRHLAVCSRSLYSRDQIAWGGILESSGKWRRASIDFGDAPNDEERAAVLQVIRRFYGLFS